MFMRSVDEKFYHSKLWKNCRDEYKKLHPYCERCLKEGKLVPVDIVHHKIWLNASNINNPNITLNFNNLESICRDCHNKEHFGDTPPKRYKFDEKGQLILYEGKA